LAKIANKKHRAIITGFELWTYSTQSAELRMNIEEEKSPALGE